MAESRRATTQRTGRTKRSGLPGAPIHILRPIDAGHFLRQFRGEHLRCGDSLPLDRRAYIFAFGGSHLFERVDGNACLFGEGLGRCCRRAVFECHLPRGTSELLLSIGLRGENALDQHGQSARRGICCEFGVGSKQPLAREQVIDAAA